MHVAPPQTGFRARPGLHAAGMVAGLVYGTLAWGARTGHPPALPAYFTLMATAWAALGLAWRSAARSGAQLPVTPILAWAVVFRLIAFSSPPLMEDDYYRYLWDGRETVVHGNPYSTTPQDHFNDTNLPPEFDSILGGIGNDNIARLKLRHNLPEVAEVRVLDLFPRRAI